VHSGFELFKDLMAHNSGWMFLGNKLGELLMMLSKDSMTINSLAENFDINRPAVSKHIKILCNAGFITITDIGRERHCVLNQEGFNEVQDFINYFDKFRAKKL
jgi:predicted transcriptional regulator